MNKIRCFFLFSSIVLVFALYGDGEVDELKNEIDYLNLRVDELETRLVDQPLANDIVVDYDAGEKSLKTLYDDGFKFLCHDEILKIGGWAQMDYRFFLGARPGVNQFVIRRARLDVRGFLKQDFAYRIYTSYGGAADAKLQEVWLEYKKFHFARIRIGQYIEPFGMEALYSSRWIRFIERGLGPTNLSPWEDIGVMVFGDMYSKKIVYAIGVFNGQGKNNEDTDESKELAARIVFQPYGCCDCHLLEKLYFGGSFTSGYNNCGIGGNSYRTGLRTKFVEFDDNAFQSGNLFRLAFECEWLYGPWVFSSEYLYSRRKGVELNNYRETVRDNAWYVSAFYLITGEHQKRSSYITPCTELDPCKCGAWGAWEVGARYDKFATNDKPFKKGIIAGADDVWALTAGVNWWPNTHIKIMGNFIYTDFGEKIIANHKRVSDEKGFAFRTQYNF